MKKNFRNGFTLVELMVTVAIISLLAGVVFANFNDARKQARDKIRMTSLKEVQLALELYKAQNGEYPGHGCSLSPGADWVGPGPMTAVWGASCDTYIAGLVPDFIAKLPTDPNKENEDNRGFMYLTDSNQSAYKLLVYQGVESGLITSFDDEFSRCPASSVACTTVEANNTTYAVYSAGAESW